MYLELTSKLFLKKVFCSFLIRTYVFRNNIQIVFDFQRTLGIETNDWPMTVLIDYKKRFFWVFIIWPKKINYIDASMICLATLRTQNLSNKSECFFIASSLVSLKSGFFFIASPLTSHKSGCFFLSARVVYKGFNGLWVSYNLPTYCGILIV